MKVIFKTTWFTHLGRFRRSAVPQEVPESLRDTLPSSHIIVEEDTVIAPEPDIRDTYRSGVEDKHNDELKDADLERANSDAYMAVMKANEVVETTDTIANPFKPPTPKKPGRPKKAS